MSKYTIDARTHTCTHGMFLPVCVVQNQFLPEPEYTNWLTYKTNTTMTFCCRLHACRDTLRNMHLLVLSLTYSQRASFITQCRLYDKWINCKGHQLLYVLLFHSITQYKCIIIVYQLSICADMWINEARCMLMLTHMQPSLMCMHARTNTQLHSCLYFGVFCKQEMLYINHTVELSILCQWCPSSEWQSAAGQLRRSNNWAPYLLTCQAAFCLSADAVKLSVCPTSFTCFLFPRVPLPLWLSLCFSLLYLTLYCYPIISHALNHQTSILFIYVWDIDPVWGCNSLDGCSFTSVLCTMCLRLSGQADTAGHQGAKCASGGIFIK